MRRKKITNTTELREFLIDQMQGVIEGSVDHNQARSICNLSQQIYNTAALELRLAQFHDKVGEAVTIKPMKLLK